MCKIITLFELQYRSLAELQAVYTKVQRDLALAAPGSDARRCARVSLENIGYAIARLRHPAPRL